MTYRRRTPLRRYALGLAVLGLALSIELVTWPLFEATPFMLSYAAVMAAAWYGGWRVGVFATAASALVSQVALIEPRGQLLPTDFAGWIRLAGFGAVCAIITLLAERLHSGAERLEQNQDALRAEQGRLERALRELGSERSLLAHTNEQLQVQKEEMEVQTEELQAQAEELQITDRQLRAQLDFNTALTSGMDEGLCAIDLDGRFTFINPAAEQILGFPAADLVGREMHATVHHLRPHGAVYPIHDCPIQLARTAGRSDRGEEWFVRRDGSFVPVAYATAPLMASDTLAGQVIVFSDISARRADERTITEGAERLRIALEAGRMGTWDWDAVSGRLVWSPGLESIFGLRPGTFDGSFETFVGLIHPDDRAAVLQTIEQSSQRGGDHVVKHRIVWPDGAVRWVEGRGRVFQDAAGRAVRMTGVTVDVTERERADETIRQLNQDLERTVAERTAAYQETIAELEAFSFSVSHDLRAPVRAMRGFADAILDEYEAQLRADPREYARRIAASAGHMDALIQDLLAYSRLSRAAFEPEPVSLAAVAEQACDQMASEIAQRNAIVEVDVDAKLPSVMGHRATVYQIVLNLVANAIKFVPDGTRPRVSIRAERLDGVVRLWVEDNGIGIDPRHQERIFRVFEQLHPREAYPGTGVGLAIVKKAVGRMNGEAGVVSAPGEGARFWIDLPLATDAAAPESSATNAAAPEPVAMEAAASQSNATAATSSRAAPADPARRADRRRGS